MVQFSFFNRVEKIGILEFCCTSSRELLSTFLICVLFPQSLLCPLAAISPVRLERGERHSRFLSCKLSLSTEELQQEWIQNFPKKSHFSRERNQIKKERSKPKWLSLAARHCISRTVHERGGGLGNGGLGGETVQTSKILKSIFAAQYHFFTRSRFRSIGFCNVYTYIYNYIEQSSSCLLEVFSVFRLLVTVRTWRSFSAGPLASEPQKHMTQICWNKGRPRGFGLNKFLAAKRTS